MRIRRHRSQELLSPFGMSFLDTVSAGFGAAIFLFLIFATIPIESASSRIGSEQFIHLLLEWDDPDAILELIVHTPEGSTIRVFDSQVDEAANPFTGLVEKKSNEWQGALIFGESHFGKNSLVSEVVRKRRISLRIIGPCPSDVEGPNKKAWSFDVAIRSATSLKFRVDEAVIPYRATLYTADSQADGGPLRVDDRLVGVSEWLRDDEQTGEPLLWSDADGNALSKYVEVKARPADPLAHCIGA